MKIKKQIWFQISVKIEFLEKLDFHGKIVRIFVTHEGSGLANIPQDVKELCTGARVLEDALSIKGSYAKDSKEKVKEWI